MVARHPHYVLHRRKWADFQKVVATFLSSLFAPKPLPHHLEWRRMKSPILGKPPLHPVNSLADGLPFRLIGKSGMRFRLPRKSVLLNHLYFNEAKVIGASISVGFASENFRHFWLKLANDDWRILFDNSRFFNRNFWQSLAQHGLVVKSDIGNEANFWLNDIR